jgi:hypothetical protein
MKNYFLRANHHALKSEFKHDFHETTYFKPSFCSYCDGFVSINFIKKVGTSTHTIIALYIILIFLLTFATLEIIRSNILSSFFQKS